MERVLYRKAFSKSLSPFKMENKIQHRFLNVRGLNLHVAEAGTGPQTVVLLHGFPEIWYTWRHQMVALSGAGFRAIAPDYRGYGLSDPPPEPEEASFRDLVDDLLCILDSLGLQKVFLVVKDFGVRPGFLFALFHPERVSGIVSLGAPYVPPGPSQYHKHLPEGFYILRWQKPGRAEADFGRFDPKTVVRRIYTLFATSKIPIAAPNQEVLDLVDDSVPLPPWLTEEDLEEYGTLYRKSGFRTALKVPYRSIDEEFDIKDPVIKVPTLVIIGEKDYAFEFPGMKDYINGGKAKEFVPELEIVNLPEGTHFVHEQFPEDVNEVIFAFLSRHA